MALIDPLAIVPLGSATPNGVSRNYTRMGDGWFRRDISTADEPEDFYVERTLDPNGESSHLLKLVTLKNNPDLTLPDGRLQTHVVIRYTSRQFSGAEIRSQLAVLIGILADDNLIDSVIQGQR